MMSEKNMSVEIFFKQSLQTVDSQNNV